MVHKIYRFAKALFFQKEGAGSLNIKDGFDQEEDAKSLNGDCQCSGGQLLLFFVIIVLEVFESQKDNVWADSMYIVWEWMW